MMEFFQGFLAFRANRRLHYHIRNAAGILLFIAVMLPALLPSAEPAMRCIAIFAAAVLASIYYFQPEVICYTPSRWSSEYTSVSMRREVVHFPRIYLAYTGIELQIRGIAWPVTFFCRL